MCNESRICCSLYLTAKFNSRAVQRLKPEALWAKRAEFTHACTADGCSEARSHLGVAVIRKTSRSDLIEFLRIILSLPWPTPIKATAPLRETTRLKRRSETRRAG